MRITQLRKSLLTASLIGGLVFSQQTTAAHLLIYGDSLSAAYGMDYELGWAQLLAQDVDGRHQVSNSSISGETSIGGLSRLPLTLEELKPDLVFIELGANDGLRGYPLQSIEDNLNKMIDLIEAADAKAIIAGISLPASYGPRYVDQFRALFSKVAEQRDLPYIDLFDESFFTTPGYVQADGLHPTAVTQPLIRDKLWSFLKEKKLLD